MGHVRNARAIEPTRERFHQRQLHTFDGGEPPSFGRNNVARRRGVNCHVTPRREARRILETGERHGHPAGDRRLKSEEPAVFAWVLKWRRGVILANRKHSVPDLLCARRSWRSTVWSLE